MAHGLEIQQGKASFVYNQTHGDPWHKLGTPVEEDMTPAEALALCKGDYVVTKEPLYAHYEVPRAATPSGPAGVASIPVLVPDRKATMRINPTTLDKEVLGVVGSGYTVVQNAAVFDKAYAIVGASDEDAYVDTCGVLDDGRRFFAYINLGDLVIDPTGISDTISRGLALYSSHDGSIAVTYAFSDVRVVCKNTVTLAVNGAERVFRAKHTSSVEDRMAEAQQVLGVSTEWAKGFKKMAEQMLSKKFTEDRFTKVLDAVYPVAGTDRQKANADTIRTRIRGTFANPRNAPLVGKNGWSMYNAIVEFVDHGRDDAEPQRLLATMDPRDKSWVNAKKLRAQDAVLSLA